jgi:hypothetical protein
VRDTISARSELRFREEAEKEREKANQPGGEETEVVAGGGEDDVDRVVCGAGEEVAAEMAVGLS